MIILAISAIINIFSSHLLAVINNISVWWHVAGAAAVDPDPDPDTRAARQRQRRVRQDHQQHRHLRRRKGCGWLLFVLPISAILTQYTITGYDASAHLSEETKSAADAAAKGIWRSIFYSAIGGWILLLSFLFAVQDADEVSAKRRRVATIFTQAMDVQVGGRSCCSSPPRASSSAPPPARPARRGCCSRSAATAPYPDISCGRRSARTGFPPTAVIVTAVIAALITLPALITVKVAVGGEEVPSPVAFFAVVSIGVVGLYLCFAVPIYYRWKAGDEFAAGQLESRQALEVDGADRDRRDRRHLDHRAVPVQQRGGMPWDPNFEWKYVNYTPLLVGGMLMLLWIYWHVSVKKWFTGPVRQIDEIEPEPEPA